MNDKFVFNPRLIRSPWSDYYGDEIENGLQAYPERYLKEIAGEGYNGCEECVRLCLVGKGSHKLAISD